MSTVTVPVAPVTGSVTVHVTLPGTSNDVDSVPATVPAGISKSPTKVPPAPLQSTWIRTAPWSPAARPVIVLLTTSTPGLSVYVSATVTVTAPPAGTVTSPPPSTLTVTVDVCPS